MEERKMDRKKRIKEALEEEMKVGGVWCVISSKWFLRWKKKMGLEEEEEKNEKSEEEEEEEGVGEIDNSHLLDGNKKLKKDILENNDFFLIPQQAWSLLHNWYPSSVLSPNSSSIPLLLFPSYLDSFFPKIKLKGMEEDQK